MTRIVVDPATQAKLANAQVALELCDDSGKVLGQFIPACRLSDGEVSGPLVDVEELDRREKKGGGRLLRDILADLERSA
jgi:hypothetical protein